MELQKIFKELMLLIIVFSVWSCNWGRESESEKFQNKRERILNIQEQIHDIETEVLFGWSDLYIVDDVLLVIDIESVDRGIHLFDKNTFKYLASTGIKGKGPGEILWYGLVDSDSEKRVFRMIDHGKKNVMLEFSIDSILRNPNYKPKKITGGRTDLYFNRFRFVNDSIALGKVSEIINHNSFKSVMAKYNLNKDEMVKFGYEHPVTSNRKMSLSSFAVSQKDSIYVNSCCNCDLITICNFEGDLICNVYGPGWKESDEKWNSYFSDVDFINEYIIAGYVGDIRFVYDEFKRPRGNMPTKFLLFDLKGNYKQTLETGHKFDFFCVDDENDRVITYFHDRPNQLGYFSLNTGKL
ncbi:hypothetical protein DMA11_18420 [Marinilabiliaceae bacterium JC017]|nr:hypothetical protein DMA11_18420 [Marinilabiliaceae bacterium JC017]